MEYPQEVVRIAAVNNAARVIRSFPLNNEEVLFMSTSHLSKSEN
jgi:hypothetical protein